MIREDPTPALVIQGGPGTGKTAVGLHRAAWLLYADPALAREGVLIVGPNRTFIRLHRPGAPRRSASSASSSARSTRSSRARPRASPRAEELATLIGQRAHGGAARAPAVEPDQVARGDVAIRVGRGRARPRRRGHGAPIAEARDRPHLPGRRGALPRAARRPARHAGARAPRVRGAPTDEDVLSAVRRTPEYQRLANRVWPRQTPEALFAALFKNRRRLPTSAGTCSPTRRSTLLLSVEPPSRARR